MWHHKLCILLVDILLAATPPPLLAGGEVLLVGQLKQQLPLQLEQPPGVDLVDGRLQQVVVQPLTLVHCKAVGIENRLQTIDDHLPLKGTRCITRCFHFHLLFIMFITHNNVKPNIRLFLIKDTVSTVLVLNPAPQIQCPDSYRYLVTEEKTVIIRQSPPRVNSAFKSLRLDASKEATGSLYVSQLA